MHSLFGTSDLLSTTPITNPRAPLRNKKHYYALWMKKGCGPDFSQAKAVNYTQNMLDNLGPSVQFTEFAERNPEIKQDKSILKQIALKDYENINKKDFNILSCLGIDVENNPEHAKIFAYKHGCFNNFQITNIFTKEDSKALKLIFHSFLKMEIWDMYSYTKQAQEAQQQQSTLSSQKLRCLSVLLP